MIAWLRGVVRDKRPPLLVLDVGGVGYELEAPMTTFYDLPETGAEVALFIHHVVREDAQSLYAFLHRDELKISQLPCEELMIIKHLLSYRRRLKKYQDGLAAATRRLVCAPDLPHPGRRKRR